MTDSYSDTIALNDQKAFAELNETAKRSKNAVMSLRREQKELKQALTFLSKEGSTSGVYQNTELDKAAHRVSTLRRKLDEVKAQQVEKADEIKRLGGRLKDVERESAPVITEDSPMAIKIRMLESRLDKSMIKYNEAMAIRNTYEAIVKRLKKERVGFDNQLAAIERTLKAKDHDFQELLNMSHDANHAKEVQKQQLAKFRAQFDEQRQQKKQDLLERKAYVQTCIDKTQRLQRKEKLRKQQEAEAAARQQEVDSRASAATVSGRVDPASGDGDAESARIAEYEEALRRIKEVTGAGDVDDVIGKFAAQEETHRSLQAMVRDAQARIEHINAERAEYRVKLEELKYSGSGHQGSRRIVDEFATHLAAAQHLCQKQRSAYERIAHMVIHVKAGVEHLHDKLSIFKTELPSIQLTDETLLDILKQCEAKLTLLCDEVQTSLPDAAGSGLPAGESSAQYLDRLAHAAASGKVILPAHNQRVRLPTNEVEEPERVEDDQDDEDVLDRPTIKKMAALAVQRETRKQKRRRTGGTRRADRD